MASKMPRRRNAVGFSLYDLKDVLSEATENIAQGLSGQGVEVDVDQLFMELQVLVRRLGGGNGYGVVASEEQTPYNFAGDLLAMSYDSYQHNDKRNAAKLSLMAMATDDFQDIVNGLLQLNKRSSLQHQIEAEEDDYEEEEESEEDDEEEDDSDNYDEDDEEEEEDISDEDLEEAIMEAEDELEALSPAKDDNEEEEEEEEEIDEEEKAEVNKNKPMGEVSPKTETRKVSADPSTTQDSTPSITASNTSKTSRTLANKLSLSGKSEDRNKAKEFVKKNPKL